MSSKEKIERESYESISGTAEEIKKGMESRPVDKQDPAEPAKASGRHKK